MMMTIVPNSRVRMNLRGGREKGKSHYGRMVQPSQQHFAPCAKGVE